MVLEPCVLTMSMATARSPFSGGDILALLLAVDDGRDLAQIDRGGAAAGDDQVGEAAGVGDAAGDLDQAVVIAARDVAGGEILVLVPDRLA